MLQVKFNLKNTMFDKAKDLYKLQKQAKEIKKKLKNTHIEAEEDGVVVIINGEQEVVEIKIDDSIMTDKKKLQTTLEKVFNKAVKKAQSVAADMMKDVMGGLNFPGM